VEKKRESVQIRLGKKERAMAEKQAGKLGLTLSAYIRMLIYEKENESNE
jgi:antitoxin component of RelBE/YafQ-DinJ toxin-antitoxin module